ncbi:DUF3373 family protein [Candidatus Electronema sp. JC]|uniref:DUF3373 family protein n=1 Tax=Candidatus Electronema sp. JC TaxID=3401570 RepID=UPI003B4334E3
MRKKISALALAGLMALPAAALAGTQTNSNNADLARRVEELSRELDELKSQLAKQQENVDGAAGRLSEKVAGVDGKVEELDSKLGELEEKSEAAAWASRFQFSGDFRARLDAYSADGAAFINPQTGGTESRNYSNDSLFTNRFRLNMEAKAAENLTFKGRLAMYKVWGMESYPRNDLNSWWPQFDGNVSRTPSDNALRVDRAFINWTNIAGLPVWFSIGRRPTTDGMPSEVRLGTDKKMATTTAYMDYAFDGSTLGYQYDWGDIGLDALGAGRIRWCYGRGFENGLQWDAATAQELATLDDTDFTGISWDVFEKDDRLLYFQSFVAFNMFQRPDFASDAVDAMMEQLAGPNRTEGKIYHSSLVYQSKVSDFNYFLSGGWSRTAPGANGMFNDYATAMLMQPDGSMAANPDWRPNTGAENGFALYAGLRWDIPDSPFKIGAEYNYSSEHWIAFSPGHDDLYLSKLATRGQAAELYMLYDLPVGEKLSEHAKAFLRLGWQHYWYDYTGADWNVKPYATDDARLMTAALMIAEDTGSLMPVESADQVYLSLDVFF